MILLSFIILD